VYQPQQGSIAFKGKTFSQAQWAQAKQQALHQLTQANDPAAQLQSSQARVVPEQHAVDLHLQWHMGPAFVLGALEVVGLKRYEYAWVEQLMHQSGATAGQAYQVSTLQAAQQRLAQSGYFESVYVSVDPSIMPGQSPVHVQVREAPIGQLILGLGGSTDNGARVSAEHTWRRIPYVDWMALSQIKLERDTRSAQTELINPHISPWGQWRTRLSSNHQLETGTPTTNQQWRTGLHQQNSHHQHQVFVQYDRSRRQGDANAPSAEAAISIQTAWSKQMFEPLPVPQKGQGWLNELGLGWTVKQAQRPYVRAYSRWHGLWPIQSSYASGRLSARAEGGAIWSQPQAPVPDSQQFLAGGDQSVRGYGLKNIGVAQTSGQISPGKIMWTSSLEWQRPIGSNTVHDERYQSAWEHTIFIDGGSVADRIQSFKPFWGLGTGLRYNSALGPLQLDAAYGQRTHQWRLHLSVGFVF
jgi:translocation and assembly module TamA